jgi:hypothetical protein
VRAGRLEGGLKNLTHTRGIRAFKTSGVARAAFALSVLTALLGIRFGTFAASGADSYGYVSQADLWLQGTLIIDEPLAAEAPWRYANWTLTPFGYRPGDRRGTMVPTYSPGLPIVMSVFKAIGGRRAVFYVVPLFGAAMVWLTFLLGARLGGPVSGLVAAATLLTSPPFLFQLMWPMSDVPAATWWLLSIVLALGGTMTQVVLAGLAATFAILTRPNLIVLAVPIIVFVARGDPSRASGSPRAWSRGEGLKRAAGFVGAMLPGVIAIAAVNWYLYESPFASGYGTFGSIYAGRYFAANLANYTRWLLQTETPYIALACAAPVVFARRGDASARRVSVLCLVVSALVFFAYLWYTPFDNWTYLRFLLPALPLMLALAGAVLIALAPSGLRHRTIIAGAFVAVVAAWGLWAGRSAFHVRSDEARYIAAGRFAASLPANAVILANQHSGSLRYYADRITMRFEWLEPDVYAEALAYLREIGRPVYVVLDDSERAPFRARYAPVADVSWLDDPPLVVAARRVYFYVVPAPRQP